MNKPEQTLPQTISRQPYPSPHGPPTKAQFNQNQILLINETLAKIETFTQIVKNFFQYKAAEDIDITITKLKAVSDLFEPNIEMKSVRNL